MCLKKKYIYIYIYIYNDVDFKKKLIELKMKISKKNQVFSQKNN